MMESVASPGTKTRCLAGVRMMPLPYWSTKVLSAISRHTEDEATERYNAAIAALQDIAPKGALEGMLATQLIATHMATMDCYARQHNE